MKSERDINQMLITHEMALLGTAKYKIKEHKIYTHTQLMQEQVELLKEILEQK